MAHAEGSFNIPSVVAFLTRVPSANGWPNWEEIRVKDRALVPFAQRFGLGKPTGYRFGKNVAQYTIQEMREKNFNGWSKQLLHPEIIRTQFRFEARVTIPKKLEDQVIRHIVDTQHAANGILDGTLPKNALDAFNEQTKDLCRQLAKFDRQPLVHNCLKIRENPPFDYFQAYLGRSVRRLHHNIS